MRCSSRFISRGSSDCSGEREASEEKIDFLKVITYGMSESNSVLIVDGSILDKFGELKKSHLIDFCNFFTGLYGSNFQKKFWVDTWSSEDEKMFDEIKSLGFETYNAAFDKIKCLDYKNGTVKQKRSRINMCIGCYVIGNVLTNDSIKSVAIVAEDLDIYTVLDRVRRSGKGVFIMTFRDSIDAKLISLANSVTYLDEFVRQCDFRWRCVNDKCKFYHTKKVLAFREKFKKVMERKTFLCQRGNKCRGPEYCSYSHDETDTFCYGCVKWMENCICIPSRAPMEAQVIESRDNDGDPDVMDLVAGDLIYIDPSTERDGWCSGWSSSVEADNGREIKWVRLSKVIILGN